MSDTEPFRNRLQTIIAALRYWVPDVADTAQITESDADGRWQLNVKPRMAGACPFTLELTQEGRYTLTLAGRSYPSRPIDSLDIFVPIAEVIADGHVLERRWSSADTGSRTHIETIIALADGSDWRGLLTLLPAIAPSDLVASDHWFLPYRRR